MKRRTEKHDKQVMRFFTPCLYRKFNSADDNEATQADELWEQAIREYHEHLDSLEDRMPVPVRELSRLDLHDAELLGGSEQPFLITTISRELSGPAPAWGLTWSLILRQGNFIRTLVYSLWDHVRMYPGEAAWPFSKSHLHWLYDELDIPPDHPGMFLHRILCSDGSILEIPFASILTTSVSLTPDAITIP